VLTVTTVARALQIPDVVIEAASHDAALEQMRAALVARRRAGVELLQIDIGDEAETVPTD
jgi:predicted dinucleotide-utilizing enzyme